MPGFTIQRVGFTHTPELAYAIVMDLIANGFTLQFPTAALPAPVAGTPYAGFKCTLEAGATIDPLNTTQPWRIAFDCTTENQMLDVFFASPLQLPNDGSVAILSQQDFNSTVQPGNVITPVQAGRLRTDDALVSTTPPSGQQFKADDSMNHFISRNYVGRVTSDVIAQSYPMSYRLSITTHGIALCVWDEGTDANLIPNVSWLVTQRPVDHITGVPLAVGHCPVVCLFALKNRPYKFIVREDDVLKPTLPVPADRNTEDSTAIINSSNQVAITEANRYVINFPNRLNTPRFAYTEELDLVAYTSSDVISQNSDVPITVYGEVAPRNYKAMSANGPNNTGMRALFLTQGAGIP